MLSSEQAGERRHNDGETTDSVGDYSRKQGGGSRRGIVDESGGSTRRLIFKVCGR